MSNNENQEKLLNLLNDKDSLLIEYTKSYERLKQAKYLTKFLNIYIAIGIILILFIYYKENLIESGIISITLLMTISAFIMNKVKSNLFDRCTDILKKYDDKIDEINNFLKNISNEGWNYKRRFIQYRLCCNMPSGQLYGSNGIWSC